MILVFKVRARLEKKLQVRQKSAFAFNFAIDSDADDLPNGEACGDGESGERGSFRFDFNPSETNATARSAPSQAKARSFCGESNPRAAQDFVVEVEGRRAQSSRSRRSKPKKKGAGKKKKGGKVKGKPAEKVLHDPAEEDHPQQDSSAKPPTTTGSSTPPVRGGGGQAMIGGTLATAIDVGEETTMKTLRPPPGFTLESWKDPALTVEERRRRRFGSGVRNMAAIQRSCDARRGLVADANGEIEAEDSSGKDRDLVRPERDRGRGAGAGQQSNASGGRSVFSFGFNIDVSFNGGS